MTYLRYVRKSNEMLVNAVLLQDAEMMTAILFLGHGTLHAFSQETDSRSCGCRRLRGAEPVRARRVSSGSTTSGLAYGECDRVEINHILDPWKREGKKIKKEFSRSRNLDVLK